MEHYTGAEAFVEILYENGVECIFFNPGVDTVPVQLALARLKESRMPTPRLILCLDESVAMSAAHGHYMISGKPQVVLVHSELGTMRVGGALHNAQWGRVPVILWAGLTPHTSRVDWLQQPFYQGLAVRSFVKWDYELLAGDNLHAVLHQGFKKILEEPRGPVYLTFPRDTLSEHIQRSEIIPVDRHEIPSSLIPAGDELDEIARILVEAENPVIFTGYTGRHYKSVQSLVALAETLDAPVITGSTRMNFPSNHPLFAGFEQTAGRRGKNSRISNTDVILVLDYDMPYVSGPGIAGPGTKIIHIDVDPQTQGRPLWGRGADIFIKADTRVVIPELNARIRSMLTEEKNIKEADRKKLIEYENSDYRNQARTAAGSLAKKKPISPDWLCHCINEAIEDDYIVVNQTISHSGAVAGQIDRTLPGSLAACAGGSIQWALGASLGVKLASPDRIVVSLVTDGGFIWGCPVATLWSSVSYKAPFLTIIFNNRSYGAIRRLVQGSFGEQKLTDEMGFNLGVDINPPPDYAGIAGACGARGWTVDNPENIPEVLRDAIETVKKGKPAVVDVRLEA